jgi:site-specific recombinase XerC
MQKDAAKETGVSEKQAAQAHREAGTDSDAREAVAGQRLTHSFSQRYITSRGEIRAVGEVTSLAKYFG